MDKATIAVYDSSGKKMTEKELYMTMPHAIRPKLPLDVMKGPPHDLRKFEDRLVEDSLIFINYQLDIHCNFRRSIEENRPFCVDDSYLGLARDLSKFLKPEKKRIAVQAAAQVLWFLEKNDIPTIECMAQRLIDLKESICKKLDILPSEEKIKEFVAYVFPVPRQRRRGNRSKKNIRTEDFVNIVIIPGIHSKNGYAIHYPKLRFIVTCCARVFVILGTTIEQIKNSDLMKCYKKIASSRVHGFIDAWVEEATQSNQSIFEI